MKIRGFLLYIYNTFKQNNMTNLLIKVEDGYLPPPTTEKNYTPNYKHGLSRHILYDTWSTMKARCEKPGHIEYHRYGAKGIKVCEEWQDVRVFIEWALSKGWKKGLTIDRVISTGNYGPDNCRIATYKEQANHLSSNLNITYEGETKTLSQWAEQYKLKPHTLRKRIVSGWGLKTAFTKKLRK
jgi:hypothetical protein